MIWSITFFVWYTTSNSDEQIDKFRKSWDEEVFSAIEMMHQPYESVMMMPVLKLKNMLKWKNKLGEDKENLIKEIKNC